MRVLVAGAGVVGCTAAALLAEAGADVAVLERDRVAAGASGRNSGLVQHPLDEALAPLSARSIELHGLAGRAPDGLLVLSDDRAALAAEHHDLAARFPELRIELLDRARDAEPAVAADLGAVRVETGHVVGPAELTERLWARAEAAGARLVRERPDRGVDATLVCTGAWTPGVTPLWGAVAEVAQRPAGHSLEELGVGTIARPGGAPPRVFSLVGAAVGSSFDLAEPDAAALAPELLARAARFVPALRDAPVVSTRACPRPLSPDGRPLIGPVAERVHVCTGHGPWGVSLGPASAELAVAALLHATPVPAPYAAERLGEAACARLAGGWA